MQIQCVRADSRARKGRAWAAVVAAKGGYVNPPCQTNLPGGATPHARSACRIDTSEPAPSAIFARPSGELRAPHVEAKNAGAVHRDRSHIGFVFPNLASFSGRPNPIGRTNPIAGLCQIHFLSLPSGVVSFIGCQLGIAEPRPGGNLCVFC